MATATKSKITLSSKAQATGLVSEDKVLDASGQLVATDSNATANLTWSVLKEGVGTYGYLSVDQSGQWTYHLANDSTKVQALAGGEKVTDSFKIAVTDQFGASAIQEITVNIVGTEDLPVIAGSTTGAVKEDVTLTASGQLVATDRDHDAELTWSVEQGGVGSYGKLMLTESGKWKYTLDNSSAKVQALNDGQSVTDSFVVSVSDHQGGKTSQTITVTVSGTNDGSVAIQTVADHASTGENQAVTINVLANDTGAGLSLVSANVPAGHGTVSIVGNSLVFNPGTAFDYLAAGQTVDVVANYTAKDQGGVTSISTATITVVGENDLASISGSASGVVSEDGALSAGGKLAVSDVDTGEAHFQVPASLAGAFGNFSFDAATGAWGYTLDNSSAKVQALTASDVVHDTLTVISADGTATQLIDVTIGGTNDAASILGQTVGAVAEDGVLSASGKLAISDVDTGEANFQAPDSLAGAYGNFSFDATTGAWDYTLDNNAPAVQALSGTDVVHETLQVSSADGTATEVIDVTLSGANDAPVVANPLADQAAVAGSAFTFTVPVDTIADVDTGDSLTLSASLSDGSALPSWLSFDAASGTFSGTPADTDAATISVILSGQDSAGAVVSDAFAITVSGSTNGGGVPTISGDIAGSVIEDTTLSDGSIVPGQDYSIGQLTLSGATQAVTAVWAGSAIGSYGSFDINPVDGQWTYVLDNSIADSLAAGDVVYDTFQASASDDQGNVVTENVTITINGSDDAPVVYGEYASTSSTQAVTVDVLTNAFDVDSGDQLTLTNVSVTGGLGGSASIVNNQIVFDPGADFSSLAYSNSSDAIVSYTVTDSAGLSATADATITVTGPAGPPTGGPFTVIDPAQPDPQAIANAILGTNSGIVLDPASLSLVAGSSSAMMYDGSLSALGIGPGLLITTGTVPGTSNSVTYFGQDNNMSGNAALDAVVNTVFQTVSYDATTVSFSFTVTDPTLTGISFNAVFGSDEYPEWVDAFVDIGVVLVNGVNVAYFNNNPMAPLSVIGSNLANNYFIDNTTNLLDTSTTPADPHGYNAVAVAGMPGLLPIEYDGVSHPLSISAPIHLGVNTIQIGIADTGDHVWDSGLFISNFMATSAPSSGVVLDVPCTDGNDTVTGTSASELFDAKAGDDVIFAGGGNDVVLGGAGNDQLDGGDGNDVINGGTGTNVISGGTGDDVIQHSAGVDHIDGGDGIDVLKIDSSGSAGGEAITLGQTLADGTTVLNVEILEFHGGAGNDVITGGSFADILDGGAGNDILTGGGGNDQITGGTGVDTAVFEGKSADYLVTNIGTDLYEVTDTRAFAPNGTDTLNGIEFLQFSDQKLDLTQFGGVGVTIQGGGNDDIINASHTVNGQPSVTNYGDTIFGNGGDDIIKAGNGADTVYGGSGHDKINGGDGNDIIVGGAGFDELTGGAGADHFVFASVADCPVNATDVDVILDFRPDQSDMIDLHQLFADANISASAVGFVSSFSSQAGQMMETKSGDGYLVQGDLNGDSFADFAIQVDTIVKPSISDFILL